MAEITPDKKAILDKAVANPELPQSKIIIAKAKERGWLKQDELTQKSIGTGEAFGLGASQGATFGTQPVLSAVAEKAIGTVTGNPAYKGLNLAQIIEENKKQVAQAKEQRPGAFVTGDILGSLSTTAPITAITSAKAAGLAAKTGAGLLGKIARPAITIGAAAAQGAGESALRAAADEGDVKKAAATGALLGAAGEAAAQGIQAVSKSIKSIGKNLAEETVVKNAGFDPMALRRMREKGDLLTEAKTIGRTLLDQDILDKPQTARGAHAKVSEVLKKTGEKLGDIYKEADTIVPDGLLNRNEVLSVIEDKLLSGTEFPDLNAVSNISDDISNLLVSTSDKKMGFQKLHKFIVELEKRANLWGRASDPTFASKADGLSEAALALREFIGNSMENASKELRDSHKIASSIYFDLSRAETALANKVLKEFSRNKALPRQGLYESIIDATIGSTPSRGAAAGLADALSKSAGVSGNIGATATRGISQAYAGKGR